MNDTIYVAVKLPITTHPQKCRIGVCEGMPTIDDGWQLFSYVVSNDADNIYSNVIDTIIDVKETNFDLENKAVARESKRTIAKVSAPVPLVMGQVLRFYVVALRC